MTSDKLELLLCTECIDRNVFCISEGLSKSVVDYKRFLQWFSSSGLVRKKFRVLDSKISDQGEMEWPKIVERNLEKRLCV